MLRGRQDEIRAYTMANLAPTEEGEDEDGTSSNGIAYVIEENPTGGMRMIANKDFECGDLVLQELPLVLFPLPAKSDLRLSLRRALNAFDDAKRADYMGLANIYAADEVEPVLGIFVSNKFEVFSTDGAEAASADRTKPFAAVFKDISRMNHSCCPNVVRYWCTASRSMHVYAARSVQKGSQIVTAYCDPFLPLRERRALLLNTYKIACACPACTNSESAANRVRIRNIRDDSAAVIQWTLTPALPDDLLLVPSLEQLKLIEDEGLEGTEYYARVLRRLWLHIFRVGRLWSFRILWADVEGVEDRERDEEIGRDKGNALGAGADPRRCGSPPVVYAA
ncbi:hypothetical protein BDN71DRAFT_1507381 [Pleurotus eryngii]|uniref:SET domain-containing protein n=1 Tax=Pleurotus eryngii TaxID=5323 RepID=A0A9P5ZZS2_PLEER|nr:hypothetical protein BDN71DRAFT_1507381 [Pleurotus eryngii]